MAKDETLKMHLPKSEYYYNFSSSGEAKVPLFCSK